MSFFAVKRYDEPITEVPLPGAVDTGITFSPAFLETEACIAAGLSLQAWDMGVYPGWLRGKIVAWYEGHRLIKLHTEAAVAKAMERKMK